METSKLCRLLLWLLFLQLLSTEARQLYKQFKLYELQPETSQQLQQLQALGLDFLNERSVHKKQLNASLLVLVSPQQADQLNKLLQAAHIKHELLLDDLSPLVRAQQLENKRSKARYQLPYLNATAGFYTHAEINAYLDSLPARYPQRAFVKNFGRSYERRTLKLLTITNGDGRRHKRVILIDAAVHAREWITPSMALYIIEQLLDNYAQHQQLLLDYDWVIMPVVNADGYEHTHMEARYWRKTRKPTHNADCVGTDLNRNFGYEWGHAEGSSDDACEDVYRGAHEFDQPESQVLRDIMLHYSGRLMWYLSLHSYGSYILLPWGYTSQLPDNYADMLEIADAGAMAIVHATNGIYTYGSTHHVLYATSGDSTDYALGMANVTVAMAMELPAGGFTGFDPWVSHIEGIVTETWVGVQAMAMAVISRY